MKSDILVLVGCVLIFVAGVIWSPIIFSEGIRGFEVGWVKLLLECSSYIGTIVAAFYAVVTLKAWRFQFNHTKRYEALAELSAAAAEMLVVRKYIISSADSLISNRFKCADAASMKSKHDADNEKWWGAYGKYMSTLEDASIFMTSTERAEIGRATKQIMSQHVKYSEQFFVLLGSVSFDEKEKAGNYAMTWSDKLADSVNTVRDQIYAMRLASVK